MPLNEYDEMISTKKPVGVVGNEYDDFLNSDVDSQKSSLKQSMFAATQTTPEIQVKSDNLSQQTKIPLGVVRRNVDEISKGKDLETTNYDLLIDKSPGLAKWLEDPNNAAAGRDDMESLSQIERSSRMIVPRKKESNLKSFPGEIANAGATGFNQLTAAGGHLSVLYGHVSPQDAAQFIADANRRAGELRVRAPDYSQEFNRMMEEEAGDVDRAARRFSGSFEEMKRANVVKALKDFGVGGAQTVGETLDMIRRSVFRPRGLAYSIAENFANSVPSMVMGASAGYGAAAFGAAGGPAVAGAAGVGGFISGSFAGELPVEIGSWINQQLSSKGFDITNPDEIIRAYSDANLMVELKAEAERKGLTTAAVDALFNAFGGKFVNAPKGGTVLRKAGAVAADVGVQTVGETTSEYAGQVAAEKGLEGTSFGQAVQEGITSLGQSIGDVAIGASLRKNFDKDAPTAAISVQAEAERALTATRDSQALQELGAAAKKLKNVQQVPQRLKNLVDIATEGDETPNIYFQTEEFDKYFSGKGLSPSKAAGDIMGDGGKAYFEAKTTGTPLSIPFSDYVANVAPTEHFDGLLPQSRTSPDGMSLQEAQEFLNALPATMQELSQEVTAQAPVEEEAANPAAKIGETVTQQLVESGVDQSTAETYSKIYESTFKNLGQRLGVDPQELFDKYGLKISRPDVVEDASGKTVMNQNVDDSLIQEAKKYKTAEEFFESQKTVFSLEKLRELTKNINKEDFDYDFLGVRVLHPNNPDIGVKIGDVLKPSKEWDDGKETGNELEWSSSVEIDYKASSKLDDRLGGYVGTKVVLIGGNYAEHGVDLGEIVIKDAKVLKILKDGGSKQQLTSIWEQANAKPDYAKIVSQAGGTFTKITDLENSLYEDEPTIYMDFPTKDGKAATITIRPSELTPEGIAAKAALNKNIIAERKEFFQRKEYASLKKAIKSADKKGLVNDILGDEKFGFLSPDGKFINGNGYGIHDNLAKELGFESANDATTAGLIRIDNRNGEMNYQIESGNHAGYEQINESIRQALASDLVNKDSPIMIDVFKGNGLEHSTEITVGEWFDKNMDVRDFLPTSLYQNEFFQSAQIDTPKFEKWFGKSKVVDEEGNPRVVYHGSGTIINEFKYEFTNQGNDQLGSGFYFTTDKEEAEGYTSRTLDGQTEKIGGSNSPNVVQAYLAIKNPLNADDTKGKISISQAIRLIEMSPEKDDALMNFGDVDHDGYNKVLNKAAGGFVTKGGYKGAVISSLFSLANDFYRDNTEAFNRAVYEVLGYDGIVKKYKNPNKLHYVAFFPEQIKSSVGNRGTFDPNNPNIFMQETDGPRGRITFGASRQFNIEFLKNADLSTFIHETGHFYLEVLGDVASTENAPQQVKDDFQKILNWLGVESRDQIKREHHEQFARGFEAYLMEGKAPAADLRAAFARFRAWLISVYRQAVSLNVKMNEEVRGVFDRLIAGDAEIADAQAEQNMVALFEDPTSVGMSPEEAQNYEKAISEARGAAEEEMSSKLMKQVQRGQTKFWKEARAKEREAVAKEVDQQPAQIAISVMQKGTLPNGEPLQEGMNPIKLNRANTVEFYADKYKIDGVDAAYIMAEYKVESLEDALKTINEFRSSVGKVRKFSKNYLKEELARVPKRYVTTSPNAKSIDEAASDLGFSDSMNLIDEMVRSEERFVKATNDLKVAKSELKDAKKTDNAERRQFVKTEMAKLPRGIFDENGVTPDFAAEVFGFSSDDEFVTSVANAPKRDELIEAITDQRMKETYGDMMIDGTMPAEAMKFVHNNKRAELLRKELQYLASEKLATLKGLVRRISRPIPTIQMVRDQAKSTIARKRVRDIAPILYQRAESKAGREAVEFLLKGDIQSAFDAKQRELLNHELYRAAVEAKEDVDSIVRYMGKFNKDSVREKIGKAGQAYLEQVDSIMERFDFRRAISLTNIDKRKSLTDWVAEQQEMGLDPVIPEKILNEAYRRHYKEMPYEELIGVHDTVENIMNLARLKNKLLKAVKMREFDAAVDEAMASIEANSKGARKKEIETRLPQDELYRFGAGFAASHRKFSNIIRQMDGYKDGGTLWELFVRPMNEATDSEAVMNSEATVKLKEIFSAYSPAEIAMMYKRKSIPEINGSLTKMGQLMVALNWGNNDSRIKLMEGRGWTEDQVKAVLNRLDERDWKVVQGIWDFFESYWPESKAISQRINGFAPPKVEAAPVETTFGTFKGGYFPLKYDDRIAPKAYGNLAKEAAERSMHGANIRATTRHGHRKARVEGVQMPVRLDFGVIFEHVAEVIHDQTHYEYLIDANRLLRDSQIQESMLAHYGDQLYGQLRDAVQDVAAGDIPAKTSFERGINWVRTGTSIAAMGWNLMTAAVQPLGLSQSIVRVGPKWIAKGAARWLGDAVRMENTVQLIHDKSDFMRLRAKTQQREINEIRNSLRLRGKILEPVEESYFWFITKAQMIADIPTWMGAYEKAVEYDLADETKAIAMADQAVLESQGGGQIKDLAQIQRGSPLQKLWTNFYSFFNTTYNLTTESIGKTNWRSPFDIGRLAVDMLILYTVPAVLGMMIRDAIKGKDDEDDEFWKRLVRENAAYLLGTMVGVREVSGVVQGYYGYSGPAGTRFFADAGNLIKQVEQGEVDEALLRSLNKVSGALFHYPAYQVDRTIRGFVHFQDGDTSNPLAIISGP